MALEAQGTNSRKKWGWIMQDYNDLVGSSNAAVGSSSDANAAQVYLLSSFFSHSLAFPLLSLSIYINFLV
jgi:hypothetical protein